MPDFRIRIGESYLDWQRRLRLQAMAASTQPQEQPPVQAQETAHAEFANAPADTFDQVLKAFKNQFSSL